MRYHSSGTFTLDPERIQCILPDPHLATVKAVQAAVASGASKVEVRADALSVSVTWDGPGLKLDDLRPALLDEGPRHELAVAVHAPLGRVARQIEVVSGGQRAVWNARGHWLGPVRDTANRFRLTRDMRSVSQVINRLLACPEPPLLADRCRYAPIPVIVNGRRVNPPTLGRNVYEVYTPDEQGDILAPATSQAEHPPRLPARWVNGKPVPCRAVLMRRTTGEGQALFLKHGVVVAAEPLEGEGLLALLSCAGLTLDLTGFALVRDEAFAERLLAAQPAGG